MIESTQLDTLNRLLAEVLPDNRFYAAKLREAGCPDRFESLEDFTRRFPMTTKADLAEDQRLRPPHGTNLTFPVNRYTRYHQTSGTSGQPIRWLDTPESWSWLVDNWVRVFEAAGTAPDDSVLFAFSFGPFLGFWTAFDAATRLGCLALPAGGMSTKARLRLLEDNRAGVLCCTPTYALRLGEAASEEDTDVSSVRIIIVAGEPGAGIPETRSRIEAMWPGARLVDHHGMTELGPVSYGWPENPAILRIMEQSFIAEVLDPRDGTPVAPGGEGELVLTSLGRIASPLLRYRTGDLVRPWSAAPEGMANYYLDGGILGRIDDMILIRGVNIYPSSVESLIRRFDEIAEFRVDVTVERHMSEMRIAIEPKPDVARGGDLVARVAEALRELFNLRIEVTLAEPGSLPRFEMKAKRWRRR